MNKNTKVLALKYRPQTFDDLIGQDVVAETISNSIKANKAPPFRSGIHANHSGYIVLAPPMASSSSIP